MRIGDCIARLQSALVCQAAQGGLDRVGGERLDGGERVGRRTEQLDAAVELCHIRLHAAEEEAGEAGVLRQQPDLLLDVRHRPANELLVPVDVLLPQPADEGVRVRVLGQRPQVDAVHPHELLVVEDGRALRDALEARNARRAPRGT